MRKTLVATLLLLMVAGSAFATVPGTDLYVPAVGHGLGAVVNGIQAWWRGDVWVFNPSTTQPATVDIFLLLRNQANPNPAVRRITVNAGETRYLDDIVYKTFGPDPPYDNTFGGLRIVSNTPVVVSGRSYDANVTVVAKGQGTAGQFFSGVPASLAIGLGDTTDVIGLDQDNYQTTGTWRSNLAFVETTGNSVDLTISRLDSGGNVLGSIPYHLEGRQVSQINYVLTAIVMNGYGTNQRVHVAVTGGTGRVIVNASRMDNRTGDPATIESVMVPTVGRFEGIVLDASTGSTLDGGIQVQISGGAVTNYAGVAGIPCGADSYTLDFSPSGGSAVTINPDGTFTTSASIGYSDGTSTIFTTNWTIAGVRAADGTWSGTLKSDTSGGTGSWASCNALNIVRQWRAAQTGN